MTERGSVRAKSLRPVLVADAEPGGLSWACTILGGHGIPVRTAETTEDILATAMEASTVLLGLPAVAEERLAIIQQIRRLGPQRPAVVAMSARGRALLSRALDAGADDVLLVPGEPDELVARLRVVEQRRQLDAEHSMLRRLAVGVAAGREHSRLCGLVARELALLLGADGGRVVRFLGVGQAELLGSWRRADFEQVASGELLALAPSWALAQVQRTERPARSELTEADARKAGAPLRESLAAPVRVEGSLWGAVAVAYAETGGAREETLIQLQRVAELISLAVSNAEARERLALMAKTDTLTGLLNHGTFHEQVEEEVARSARYGHPLSLALLDIDHFKLVNDRHGHRAGDDALRLIAELVRNHARETDIVGRVGGEELAWLMPECPITDAMAGAERLRALISSTPIADVGRITVSIGVAELVADRSAADLFEMSDAAMYRAKDAGRDCVRGDLVREPREHHW
jgi:diguanylate cyclase (GGDEF)-like protein